jgi:release factor glutamine methyltransferase
LQNSAANNAPLRLEDFIATASKRLKEAGIESAVVDAHILVAYGLKCDRTQLLSQKDRVLAALELQKLRVFIECRARHEPVARILGRREFWSLPFGLNHATLEPRPDSETVVETALKLIKVKEAPLRILDLGTGTGCLLLSLLHELPKATGLGIDAAAQATEQAQTNAKNLGLDDRAAFRTGDWFEGINERFDVIVSNPPYIVHKDIASLMPEVRDHDPHLALDGGNDGLACYRLLVPRLPHFLKPSGFAVFEVGQGQADMVGKMFTDAGFKNVATHKDLGGIERVVTCINGSPPSRG